MCVLLSPVSTVCHMLTTFGEGGFLRVGSRRGTCHYSEIRSGEFTGIWPRSFNQTVSIYGANPFYPILLAYRTVVCVCVCVLVCVLVCVCVCV